MYRTDLFEKAGLTMPAEPTWEFIGDAARKLTDRGADINGICLRGKAGWGENMALIGSLANSFGARWFDEEWKAQFDQPEWKAALQFYADLMKDAGPQGASSNGFNESRPLPAGQVRHVDRRHLGRVLRLRPEAVDGGRQGRLHHLPEQGRRRQPRQLAVVVEPGDPDQLEERRRRQDVHHLATDKAYTELVAGKEGWANVPPGTRTSLYENQNYLDAAAFADEAKAAMDAADITKPTVQPVPYTGRPVRGDPGVPVDWNDGRPALLRGACGPVERR